MQPARPSSAEGKASTSRNTGCLAQANHPSVLEHFDDFIALAKGKRIAVFTDYDGKILHHGCLAGWLCMSDLLSASILDCRHTHPHCQEP